MPDSGREMNEFRRCYHRGRGGFIESGAP